MHCAGIAGVSCYDSMRKSHPGISNTGFPPMHKVLKKLCPCVNTSSCVFKLADFAVCGF